MARAVADRYPDLFLLYQPYGFTNMGRGTMDAHLLEMGLASLAAAQSQSGQHPACPPKVLQPRSS